MRFLLSGLFAMILAVTMPLAFLGAASGHAGPIIASSDVTVSSPTDQCCTARWDAAHGDCSACAAIHPADSGPATVRSPRSVRHNPITLTLRSTNQRLPLPPPRKIIV